MSEALRFDEILRNERFAAADQQLARQREEGSSIVKILKFAAAFFLTIGAIAFLPAPQGLIVATIVVAVSLFFLFQKSENHTTILNSSAPPVIVPRYTYIPRPPVFISPTIHSSTFVRGDSRTTSTGTGQVGWGSNPNTNNGGSMSYVRVPTQDEGKAAQPTRVDRREEGKAVQPTSVQQRSSVSGGIGHGTSSLGSSSNQVGWGSTARTTTSQSSASSSSQTSWGSSTSTSSSKPPISNQVSWGSSSTSSSAKPPLGGGQQVGWGSGNKR